MAGFDGLVNNVREAVKHTRELIKKKKKNQQAHSPVRQPLPLPALV